MQVPALCGLMALSGLLVAWSQALTSDMVLSQPVIYEVGELKVPTLLLIGLRDTTAIGCNRAPPEAAHRIDGFEDVREHAVAAWRPHFSSA